MNLHVATFAMAALLLVMGLPFLAAPKASAAGALKLIRDKTASYIFAGAALAWFSFVLLNLGEADFGDIKHILILVFGGAGLLSFAYTPDFLCVRGIAVLMLLLCRQFLDAAFMQDPEARLVLVSFSYVLVIAAIYFGSLPYRARDMFEKFETSPLAGKVFGLCLSLASLSLIFASFYY